MNRSPDRRSARMTSLGVVACAVLTFVVAPSVRGASGAGDGGGCNGGRGFAADDTTGSSSSGEDASSSSTGLSGETTTMVVGECGDGVRDEGEACDDGNKVDEDACPSGAKGTCAAAKCGDGIVYMGVEECDGEEGCGENCEWMAECGNGAVEVGEACDDGNDVDEDACPSGAGGCKAEAKCGDGYLWAEMEGCDDGNEEDGDQCPSGEGACVAVAKCGDGFVEEGVEGCDDKNDVDEDACPSGEGACMAAASCGDGFVEAGVEGCDDQNGEDLDECSNACAAPRWVFVTSNTGFNGNLGGIAGADASCQALASAASLPGTYKAWLTGSDPNSAPAMRFGSEAFTGWYRLRTNPPTGVAEGWADLTEANQMPASYLQSPIVIDENGVDIGNAGVWSNTAPDGSQDVPSEHCEDWGDIDNEKFGRIGRAKSTVVGGEWTAEDHRSCDGGARLYCFQTD